MTHIHDIKWQSNSWSTEISFYKFKWPPLAKNDSYPLHRVIHIHHPIIYKQLIRIPTFKIALCLLPSYITPLKQANRLIPVTMSRSEEIKEINQSGKLIATYIRSHTTDTSGTKFDRIDVDVCVPSFFLSGCHVSLNRFIEITTPINIQTLK